MMKWVYGLVIMLSTSSVVWAEVPSKLKVVQHQKSIPYRSDDAADREKHCLDVFYPKDQKNVPVLFFVHGGAWRSGNKEMYAKIGEVFAARGLVTVIPNYRLSPKVKHPGHIEDVCDALKWTIENIEKYGGNRKQIFVSGHSAGGHLVALLATNPTYLQAKKLTVEAIRGVIPISGVYSILPIGLFTTVFGSDSQLMRDVSPLEQVRAGLPPFLILYGDADFPTCDLVSQAFQKRLLEKKVQAECCEIAKRDHIEIIRNAMLGDDPIVTKILSFIREKGEPPLKKNLSSQ
ncbi:alpha/beta hydrolase [Tuwongella immobilis]|uniref:BD-FAE-like domain-containing protein n=1 Tax=Tuwongella immobilis TaxID=692036 RepID=A0A6C2YQ07_9BACT|nr:alpha/beta hydrolase [Tuwongella immobilis]VIP03105.1 alpha beta hydrolase : Lipase OS=Candidatus Acetothermus autotrophicum GN=HGMM_OP4C789 PE=4 SV=1: Abhydrolase_3 [Tuwongella immobilis]VTS03403.1 alpha beta hydrolase : Lipase OS=Candidatus Acetothermus autotrophicum GN=HGMM_OP4C789 PE=4 SV=1: Abhydrolase_3 [Tuwongella immobilis]